MRRRGRDPSLQQGVRCLGWILFVGACGGEKTSSSALDLARTKVALADPKVVAGSTVQVTVEVINKDGGPADPAAEQPLVLTLAGGGSAGHFAPAVRQATGVYVADFAAVAVGAAAEVQLWVGGDRATGAAPTLQVVAGPAVAARSSVAVTPTVVAAGQQADAYVYARDGVGALLGRPVDVAVAIAAAAVDPGAVAVGALEDLGDGRLRAPVTGQRAGAAHLCAQLDGVDLAAGCAALTVVAGAAAKAAMAAGDGQTALAGEMVAEPVTVRAADAFDNAVAGLQVTWGAAGATVVDGEQVTDAGGQARALVRLGARVGVQQITARLAGAGAPPGGLEATAEAYAVASRPSATTSTVAVTAAGTTLADGVAQAQIQVTLRDANGAPVAGSRPRLQATDSRGGNRATTAALSDSAGRSSIALASTVAERKALTLVRPLAVAGGVADFGPGPPAASASRLRAPASPAAADGADVALVGAEFADALANPCAGLDLAACGLQATGAEVAISWSAPAADDQGRAWARVTSAQVGDVQVGFALPVALAAVPPVAVRFGPGPATGLLFERQPLNEQSLVPFARAPRLRLVDAVGRPAVAGASAGEVVHLTAVLGDVLLGTTHLAATSGVADFSGLDLRLARAGPQVLRAQLAGGASVDSATFVVSATAAAGLDFATLPAGVTAGVAWAPAPSLRAVDAAGNLAAASAWEGLTVALSLASGGPLGGPAAAPLSAGEVAFPGLVASRAVPMERLVAHLGGSQQAWASPPFAVAAGAAARLTFVGGPPLGARALVPLAPAPVIAIEDALGNRVVAGDDASAPVTLSLAAGGGQLAAGTSLTQPATSGLATFAGAALTLDAADPLGVAGHRLAASKADRTGTGGSPPLAAQGPAFEVAAGAAAELRVGGAPASCAAGAGLPTLVVEALDAAGNVAPLATSVTLATQGDCGPLMGAASLAAADGQRALFPGLRVDRAAASGGACWLTATADGGTLAGRSPDFVVAAGDAWALAFVAQPSGGQAGVSWPGQPSLQVFDALGNPVVTGPDAAASVAVGWAPGAGTGTLAGSLSQVAAAGRADFVDLSAAARQQGARLRASATLAGRACVVDSAPIAIGAGLGDSLAWRAQPVQERGLQAWQSPPVVAIVDKFGQVVDSGADSACVVTLRLSQGAGSLSGDTAVVASGGVADFSAGTLTIDKAGTDKVLAAEAVLAGQPRTVAGSPFTVLAGPAGRLRWAVQPGGGVGGQLLSTQPQLRIEDVAGNLIVSGADSSAAVDIAVEGAAQGVAGQTSVVATGGIATFTGLVVNKAGVLTRLVATKADRRGAGGVTTILGTSDAFATLAGAAAQLAFLQTPGTSTAGSLMSRQVQVQVQDGFGNLVGTGPDAAVAISVVLSSGATLSGTRTQNAAGGLAVFSDLSAVSAGSHSLVASATLAGGATQVVSMPPFTIMPAARAALAFVVPPDGGLLAQPWATTPRVASVDAFANGIALPVGTAVSVALASGNGALSGTQVRLAAANGQASFPALAATTLGTKTLAAGATVSGASLQAVSAPFAITAAGQVAVDVDLGDPAQATLLAPPAPSGPLAQTALGVALAPITWHDGDAAAWAAGSGHGTAASGDTLTLGAGGGCNGALTNCTALDPSWAPAWGRLLGYWPLEGTGTIADGATIAAVVGPALAAHNADGSGLAFVDGKVGAGDLLEGVDDRLEVVDPSVLARPALTIAAWVRSAAKDPEANLFELGDDPLLRLRLVDLGGLGVAARLTSGSAPLAAQVDGAGGRPNAWTHVAATLDGGEVAVYLQGVLAAVQPCSQPADGVGQGRASFGGLLAAGELPFAGVLDELAIWDGVLTAAEVALLARRGAPEHAGWFVGRPLDGQTPRQALAGLALQAPSPYGRPLAAGAAQESPADFAQMGGVDLASNKVAQWRLDEPQGDQVASGVDFRDLGGQDNHAFLANRAGALGWAVPAPTGAGVRLLAADEALATDLQQVAPAEVTVALWFRASSGGRLVGFGDQQVGPASDPLARSDRHLYLGDDGQLRFGVYDGAAPAVLTSAVPAGLLDDRWHHAAAALGAAGATLYLDGSPVAQDPALAAGAAYQGWWRFGADALAGSAWPGAPAREAAAASLAEAAIWGRALAAAEVAALYGRGALQLGLQVRACALAGCADAPPWRGPDGTSATLFSAAAGGGAGVGPVAVDLGTVPAWTAAMAAGRWAQYRVWMAAAAAAAGPPTLPSLQAVTVAPALAYADTAPAAETVVPIAYHGVESLAVHFGVGGCPSGPRLSVSAGGGTWLWRQGGQWRPADGTLATASPLADLQDADLAALDAVTGPGMLSLRVFLPSDGHQGCAVQGLGLQVVP